MGSVWSLGWCTPLSRAVCGLSGSRWRLEARKRIPESVGKGLSMRHGEGEVRSFTSVSLVKGICGGKEKPRGQGGADPAWELPSPRRDHGEPGGGRNGCGIAALPQNRDRERRALGQLLREPFRRPQGPSASFSRTPQSEPPRCGGNLPSVRSGREAWASGVVSGRAAAILPGAGGCPVPRESWGSPLCWLPAAPGPLAASRGGLCLRQPSSPGGRGAAISLNAS